MIPPIILCCQAESVYTVLLTTHLGKEYVKLAYAERKPRMD